MERSLWTRRLRVPKRCQNLGALMWLRSQKRWSFFLVYSIRLSFVLVVLTHVCVCARLYIFLLQKINSSLVKSLKTLESIKQKISGPSLQEPFCVARLPDASRHEYAQEVPVATLPFSLQSGLPCPGFHAGLLSACLLSLTCSLFCYPRFPSSPHLYFK